MANWMNMNMGWGMGFGWIFMALFWLLVAVGIIVAIRLLSDRSRGGQEKSALEILQERYARGETEREEYEQKKRALRG